MIEQKYLDRMLHAIGLDNSAPNNGVYEAYRNCSYYTEVNNDWEYLVALGYAKRINSEDGKEFIYSVTRDGLHVIADATGLLIRYTIEIEPKK